jgi:hypothetical protein
MDWWVSLFASSDCLQIVTPPSLFLQHILGKTRGVWKDLQSRFETI